MSRELNPDEISWALSRLIEDMPEPERSKMRGDIPYEPDELFTLDEVAAELGIDLDKEVWRRDDGWTVEVFRTATGIVVDRLPMINQLPPNPLTYEYVVFALEVHGYGRVDDE